MGQDAALAGVAEIDPMDDAPKIAALSQSVASIFRPPPKLSGSEWAAQKLYLSPEYSAEPGRYNLARAPYQRGILDACTDPKVAEVVLKTSAQVGKTLVEQAILGYYVDQDPSPTLVVEPTLEMGEAFSKERLTPMVRDMPCLTEKIADPKAKDSGNTILHKRFPGGHLTIAGANSPASLASRPIRILLLDEVDRYPPSAGTEGDPVDLARARTKTFWNRRIILASTPTDEETSRIELAWSMSDQRHYNVPCPHCGAMQALRWKQVKWEDGKPETAHYECEHCKAPWSEADRVQAIARGEWIATYPERLIAGFHLNEIYSPWRRVAEIVIDFLKAKRKPETLKVWVNTSLGETWRDEESQKLDPEVLAARREPYIATTGPVTIPEGVLAITMQVDVQDDRLEVEHVGWGVDEESWGLEHVVLRGDPGKSELWERLDDQLARKFTRTDGVVLLVELYLIDSQGHYTSQVYAWAKRHIGRGYALKGQGGRGKPLVEIGRKLKKHGIRLAHVGTDTAKDLLLLSRAKITVPGPGYMHFPSTYSKEFFEQMCAEKLVVRYKMGQEYKAWECPKHTRNEGLDLRAYSLAAISLVRPVWEVLAQRLKAGAPAPKKPAPPVAAGSRPRSGGGFASEEWNKRL